MNIHNLCYILLESSHHVHNQNSYHFLVHTYVNFVVVNDTMTHPLS